MRFCLLVTYGVCISGCWINLLVLELHVTAPPEQELHCLQLTRRLASLSDFGHRFIASWLYYCYAIYQGFKASTQKASCDWCWIQQWEWNYFFVSQGLFIQKLHKLKILLHILKALIAWSCDKAYAWIAVSITPLELSQGWSLVQEAGYPQRKGVKQDCGNHSFISDGETASLFPFQMENSFIGTYSSKQQGKIYSFCMQILVNMKTTGNSVLPWRLSEERRFQMMNFHHFSDF